MGAGVAFKPDNIIIIIIIKDFNVQFLLHHAFPFVFVGPFLTIKKLLGFIFHALCVMLSSLFPLGKIPIILPLSLQ